jgi:hypothetical protein
MMIINSSHDPSEKHEDIHTMATIEIIVAWETAEPQKINWYWVQFTTLQMRNPKTL